MKITIYHSLIGATLAMLNTAKRENVWGHEMLVQTIDTSDTEQVEQLKADGWQDNPQAVIDENEGHQLQAENNNMKNQLESAKALEKVTQLESQVASLIAENADLKAQLAKKPTTKTVVKTTDKTAE